MLVAKDLQLCINEASGGLWTTAVVLFQLWISIEFTVRIKLGLLEAIATFSAEICKFTSSYMAAKVMHPKNVRDT